MRWIDAYNEAIVTAIVNAGCGGERDGDATAADVPTVATTWTKDDASRDDVMAGTATQQQPRDQLSGAHTNAAALKTPQQLRDHLLDLLQYADRQALAQGIPQDSVEAANLAVCAFIDEALLSQTWEGSREWMLHPLQRARHDTDTAGEEFYKVLDGLLDEFEAAIPPPGNAHDKSAPKDPDPRRDVLEVFAMCLAQGFTGMHFLDERAISLRLARIGAIVPAVVSIRDKGTPLFPAAYPDHSGRHAPLETMRRFDGTDWMLWLLPPLVTGLVYLACTTHLDAVLNALVQGGTFR